MFSINQARDGDIYLREGTFTIAQLRTTMDRAQQIVQALNAWEATKKVCQTYFDSDMSEKEFVVRVTVAMKDVIFDGDPGGER